MQILAGLAVGVVVGANWKKIRPHVEPLMPVLKEAGEKASDAYTTLVKGVMERMEQYADERAEARHREEQAAGPAAAAQSSSTPVASANGTATASPKANPVAEPAKAASSPVEAVSTHAT